MMELIAAALPGRAAAREELLEIESAGRVRAEEELARVRAVLEAVDRERRRQAAELDAVRDVLAEAREENRRQAAGRARAEAERDALAARLDAVVTAWTGTAQEVADQARRAHGASWACVALLYRLHTLGWALARAEADPATDKDERRRYAALRAEISARMSTALANHPTSEELLAPLTRLAELDPADDIATTREDKQ
ncbi:hypothetical protein [Marinactinospora rubrisoli]|uniref:Uncharacterized protein n=1 Tax=Marinactinospora rubrisoli TaxID=2715399 RepID=A0ABW2KNB9_9ACTN